MSNAAKKFIPRAPRYVIRSDDDQLVRFTADLKNTERYSTTRFVNLSATGLAFVTQIDVAPRIGEFIKVEFPLPSGERMAWFAKVARIEVWRKSTSFLASSENYDDSNDILVGLEFQQFSPSHRERIQHAIEEKVIVIRQQKRQENFEKWKALLRHYGLGLTLFFLCSVATFVILYILSLPSETYDASRGSPWGERFKSMTLESEK